MSYARYMSLVGWAEDFVLRSDVGRLLERFKEERNVLMVAGAASIALMPWCPLRAYLKALEKEQISLVYYLADLLALNVYLGRVSRREVRSAEDILYLSEPSLSDVERVLREISEEYVRVRRARKKLLVSVLRNGGAREDLYVVVNGRKVRTVQDVLSLPARVRGEVLEAVFAEVYPTIRWHFVVNGIAIVGDPDGITERFVYEFKTTRSRFLFPYMRAIALAQAELYARLFRRRERRIQVLVLEDFKLETDHGKADRRKADILIGMFRDVVEGERVRTAERWKCRCCEYRGVCEIVL